MIHEHEHNYIASLSHFNQDEFVLVYHELSTGESQIILIENDFSLVMHELGKQQIKELVISSVLPEIYVNELQKSLQIVLSYEDVVNFIGEFRDLYDNFLYERFLHAFSCLLNYIKQSQISS